MAIFRVPPVAVDDDDAYDQIISKFARTRELQCAYKDPRKFKTALCRHYQACGHCSYGVQCSFAHGAHELRPMNNTFKTRLCTSWLCGEKCRYGDKCQFAHGAIELKKPSIAEPCLDLIKYGACEYGESCRYSHDVQVEYKTNAQDNHKEHHLFRPSTPPGIHCRTPSPTWSSVATVTPSPPDAPNKSILSLSEEGDKLKESYPPWTPFTGQDRFGPLCTFNVTQRVGRLQL
jgi:hypothetical protein